jgi:hypothetical protein
LQKLALANLDGIEFLQKIRDVFMLAFYSGGLPLERLKKEIASLKTRGVDQQMQILRQFPLKHRTEAEDFIHSVSPEAYEKAHDSLQAEARRRPPPRSGSDIMGGNRTRTRHLRRCGGRRRN